MEVDQAEAVRLFQLAADQGDANALNNLGRCYQVIAPHHSSIESASSQFAPSHQPF